MVIQKYQYSSFTDEKLALKNLADSSWHWMLLVHVFFIIRNLSQKKKELVTKFLAAALVKASKI